ncbi:ATP-binding cassette domain-containing protein [Candidatus Latescibacterota bacterium]
MDAISVDSLTKTYESISALDNLNITVEAGSMYGLIGPDGSGKTTFMRIATCLLYQSSGRVSIQGFDTLKEAAKVKQIIGYMPQRFSLYQDLSVLENLTFFADLFGVSRKKRTERIERLLTFSRLGPFVRRRAGNLSGGMKQKLALSCTLIHDPEVLFLDEPTTGVDPVSRREFWEILADIKASGTTIVVSTPYMDEAERCDIVGLIYNGSLIEEGPPASFPDRFGHDLLAVRGTGIIRRTRKLVYPDIVHNVRTFGDRIHLTVSDAVKAQPVVQEFFKDVDIDNFTVESITPTIEDVFVENMSHAE